MLALLVLAGGGVWLYKAKPTWLGMSVKAAANDGKKDENGKDPKEATPVELAAVTRGPISSFVAGTANLRALRDVAVATQVEGVVAKVMVEEGDRVSEGQLLCQLDDTQPRIRLQLATEKLAQAKLQMDKAQIRQEKARAQMGHTRVELERYEKAAKEGLVSDKEVATYRYKLEELQHDEKVAASETRELQHRVGELEAEIAQTKLELTRSQIRAPFDGYIPQRTVNIGQRVRVLDSLYTLGSFSPLLADVHLSERDVRIVKPGQAATVRLGSDDSASVPATVERISPVVDQASGTVKVTVAMQPQAGFRPGSFVRVDIRTDTRSEALLVPRRAIVEEDGQNFLYIANGTSAKRTRVDLGYTGDGVVEVVGGLQPGQKVVVAGQGALKENSKIRVMKG